GGPGYLPYQMVSTRAARPHPGLYRGGHQHRVGGPAVRAVRRGDFQHLLWFVFCHPGRQGPGNQELNMDISYIINELGEDREHYFNAVAPPIVQTSNFRVSTVDQLKALFEDEYSGYLYSRGLNPTVEILRQKLAALDGAEDCLVFNSGAAATFAAVLANVKGGDHIVSVSRPYTWAQRMFDVVLPRFGVSTTYVEGTQIEDF